jgi:hypothetical protein
MVGKQEVTAWLIARKPEKRKAPLSAAAIYLQLRSWDATQGGPSGEERRFGPGSKRFEQIRNC